MIMWPFVYSFIKVLVCYKMQNKCSLILGKYCMSRIRCYKTANKLNMTLNLACGLSKNCYLFMVEYLRLECSVMIMIKNIILLFLVWLKLSKLGLKYL